jgi:hypothetical protein
MSYRVSWPGVHLAAFVDDAFPCFFLGHSSSSPRGSIRPGGPESAYGIDGGASEDSGVLLIDNPAVRSAAPAKPRRRRPDGTEVPTDDELAARIMATERVKQGRLVGRYTGLPREAAGMYRVSGQGRSHV